MARWSVVIVKEAIIQLMATHGRQGRRSVSTWIVVGGVRVRVVRMEKIFHSSGRISNIIGMRRVIGGSGNTQTHIIDVIGNLGVSIRRMTTRIISDGVALKQTALLPNLGVGEIITGVIEGLGAVQGERTQGSGRTAHSGKDRGTLRRTSEGGHETEGDDVENKNQHAKEKCVRQKAIAS
jgi:hypothetical protein